MPNIDAAQHSVASDGVNARLVQGVVPRFLKVAFAEVWEFSNAVGIVPSEWFSHSLQDCASFPSGAITDKTRSAHQLSHIANRFQGSRRKFQRQPVATRTSRDHGTGMLQAVALKEAFCFSGSTRSFRTVDLPIIASFVPR